MQCPQCGESGEGRFCAQCGTELASQPWNESTDRYWQQGPSQQHAPPPPAGGPSRRPVWPFVAVLAAALVIGGAALWFLTAPDDRVEAKSTSSGSSTESSSQQTTSTSEGSTTTTQPSTSTTTTTTTTSPSTPPVDEQLATTRRDSLRRANLDGRYAVTLSSKQDGQEDSYQTTESGSHTFRLPDILALHEALDQEYGSEGQLYLFTDQDLESTSDQDYDSTMWMTILDPGGLQSKEDALDWCESTFAHQSDEERANSCGARRLESP